MEDKTPIPGVSPTSGESASEHKAAGAVTVRQFPTAGDIFAMLGIVLGLQIVVSLVVWLVLLATGHNLETLDPAAKGQVAALTYLFSMAPALLVILYYRRVRGGSEGGGMRFSLKGFNPMLLLWAFLLMAAASVVCEPAFSLLPAPSNQEMGRGLWTALMLILFAPVLEELICRGVVLTSLRNRYGTVAAWILSSLFFGVLHLQPLLVVNAFVIGLILGFIYIVTDSLWAAIILHALNNALAYVLLLTGHSNAMLVDLVGSRTLYVFIYIVAVAMTAVSAYMVWRTLSRLKHPEKNQTTV